MSNSICVKVDFICHLSKGIEEGEVMSWTRGLGIYKCEIEREKTLMNTNATLCKEHVNENVSDPSWTPTMETFSSCGTRSLRFSFHKNVLIIECRYIGLIRTQHT